MAKITIYCANGHSFTIQEEEFDQDIVGGIAFCPVGAPVGPDQCGARIFWKRTTMANDGHPQLPEV